MPPAGAVSSQFAVDRSERCDQVARLALTRQSAGQQNASTPAFFRGHIHGSTAYHLRDRVRLVAVFRRRVRKAPPFRQKAWISRAQTALPVDLIIAGGGHARAEEESGSFEQCWFTFRQSGDRGRCNPPGLSIRQAGRSHGLAHHKPQGGAQRHWPSSFRRELAEGMACIQPRVDAPSACGRRR